MGVMQFCPCLCCNFTFNNIILRLSPNLDALGQSINDITLRLHFSSFGVTSAWRLFRLGIFRFLCEPALAVSEQILICSTPIAELRHL